MMRDSGFTEINFCGLRPMNIYAESTSFLFNPDFKIKPLTGTHPGHTIGSLQRNAVV